jgi:hypothetical protein
LSYAGTGKKTAAKLMAQVTHELNLRSKNSTIVINISSFIGKGPTALSIEFSGNDGGTIVIENWMPVLAGAKAQPASVCRDLLDLVVSESTLETSKTTFILSGQKDDVMELIAYDPLFRVRFPLQFEFEDFSEQLLEKLFIQAVDKRSLKLGTMPGASISLSSAAARRIARGSGKKGFLNGLTVESFLDRAERRMSTRLGRALLAGTRPEPQDLVTLQRVDVLGAKPDIENLSVRRDLDRMVGLRQVKAVVDDMMALQLQNWEAEMRGEPVQEISLNRIFLGSPGTGKTTVAKIFGKLLKEFGYLSNGDLITVTASDLMGGSVGSSAGLTKSALEKAQGNVLFIDEAYVLDPKRSSDGSVANAGVSYGVRAS